MEAAQKGPDRGGPGRRPASLRHRIRSGVGTAAEKDQAGGGDEDQALLVGKVVRISRTRFGGTYAPLSPALPGPAYCGAGARRREKKSSVRAVT